MAMCVMAVVGVAPCQCFSPGGNQTTSPGRMSSIGAPQRWTLPLPAVTIRVWPSGWVCHAVRAPGSKVTLAPTARAGSGASNRGSMRTVPVKYSAGPLLEGCEPLLLMSILNSSNLIAANQENMRVNRLNHNALLRSCPLVGERNAECPAPQSYEFWHALRTLGIPDPARYLSRRRPPLH